MSEKKSRLLLTFAFALWALPSFSQSDSGAPRSTLIPELVIIGTQDRMKTTDITPGG